MDLPSPKFQQPPPSLFSSTGEEPHCMETFPDPIPDPLCKLNLTETSEFVRCLPLPAPPHISAQKRSSTAVEQPYTPGRPIFGFSAAVTGANSVNFSTRKSVPSKWDDAEKWLISSPSHHRIVKQPQLAQAVVFADKSRVTTEEKVSGSSSLFHQKSSARAFNFGASASPELLLTDKFTDDDERVCTNFRISDPIQKGFLFRSSVVSSSSSAMKDAAATEEMVQVHEEVHNKDVGTEMTPRGSNTKTRFPTPYKILSPPRHNTPADRSGPLAATTAVNNISSQLQEQCHLAKLQPRQFSNSNWSSREEEEEDVSKSLRHFEVDFNTNCNNGFSKIASWEEEEKHKCCLRYQREDAKIQAWVNLENAKAEAQSRKLEVKIQKMRSKVEEKLMKRMAIVHRKAEEWRAEARQQHSEQIPKASANAKKMSTTMMVMKKNHRHDSFLSCGCFPCCTNPHGNSGTNIKEETVKPQNRHS